MINDVVDVLFFTFLLGVLISEIIVGGFFWNFMRVFGNFVRMFDYFCEWCGGLFGVLREFCVRLRFGMFFVWVA